MGAEVEEFRRLAAATHAEHNIGYAAALGGRVLRTPDLVAVAVAGRVAFLDAIVPLRPVEPAAVTAVAAEFYGERPHTVADYFQSMDLAAAGYEPTATLPVMVRKPAPPPPLPAVLTVVRVRNRAQLAEFERIVVDGMEITPYADAPPGSLWAPGVLERPSMQLHVGRVGGRAVTCAAGVVVPNAVGVFAVATLHAERRRGYGAAITAAALAAAPPVPAVLSASPLGEGVYASLGFAVVAQRQNWRTATA